MGRHIVLVGGGHAHMTTMLNAREFVERGHAVTLVSPSEHHYYSGMGPGMLAGTYRPQQVRFNVRRMVEARGAQFVESRVVGVDAGGRLLSLESGEQLPYDVVSFNTGSFVPMENIVPEPQPNVFPVKPIIELLRAQRLIREQLAGDAEVRILVVGGGPAGVEICANAWRLAAGHDGRAHITLLAGHELLPASPAKVRRRVLASFKRRGIEVVTGPLAERVADGEARFSDGGAVAYDVALCAVGVRPYPLFRDSGLPTADDGGLLVDDNLECVGHPDVFGGGDCISMQGRQLARVGVYAVRQNPVLHHNLLAALEGGELEEFKPGGDYLLILNMGDGSGILRKRGLVWHSRLAFRLKDFIDRRFMRRFQVSGELEEEFEGID